MTKVIYKSYISVILILYRDTDNGYLDVWARAILYVQKKFQNRLTTNHTVIEQR